MLLALGKFCIAKAGPVFKSTLLVSICLKIRMCKYNMYLKKDGSKVGKLVLPGGGASVFSMYVGLFKELDISSMPFDIVCSSAASLWFADALCTMKETQEKTEARREALNDMHAKILNLDLVTLLESDANTFVTDDNIAILREIFQPVSNMTLEELAKECNGRNVEFAVSIMAGSVQNMYRSILVSAKNAPKATIFDVVLASCAIPVVFPPVALNIDNEDVLCVDGSMSDYGALVNEGDQGGGAVLNLRPRVTSCTHFYNTWKTNIPIIDNILRNVAYVLSRFESKTCSGSNVVLHDCMSSVYTAFWDETCIKQGEDLFNAEFTWKIDMEQ